MDLSKDAIDAIVALAKTPDVLPVNDRAHIVVPPGWLVREDYQPVKHLVTITLQSVADYFREGAALDGLDVPEDDPNGETLLVHIESPRTVQVLGGLDKANRREVILRAELDNTEGASMLPLKTWLAPEKMILGLLVLMEETGERDNLIAMLSHVRDSRVVEAVDDGIAQQLIVSSGVTLLGAKSMRSVVTLSPRWTFGEIEQPDVDFVIRARPGEGDSLPAFCLTLADVTWQAKTIIAIRDWLKAKLPADTIVLA